MGIAACEGQVSVVRALQASPLGRSASLWRANPATCDMTLYASCSRCLYRGQSEAGSVKARSSAAREVTAVQSAERGISGGIGTGGVVANLCCKHCLSSEMPCRNNCNYSCMDVLDVQRLKAIEDKYAKIKQPFFDAMIDRTELEGSLPAKL
jgi:hypothetical protein